MDDHSAEEPAPPQFTLSAMFVLIAVVALLLGLTLPAINAAREAARRSQCMNNLKQFGVAMHNYHDTHKAFPFGYTLGPDMSPWTSWRVAISPYMESNPFYDRYRHNEPWNSRSNMQLGNFRHPCYQCPSEPTPGFGTSYVAVLGPHTAWPVPKVSHFEDFSRGATNTVLVPEMSESGIHWMEPRDLQFDQMEFKIYAPSPLRSSSGRGSRQALSSAHPGGIQAVFADGHVEFIPDKTSSEVLREMLLISDPEQDAGDGQLRREE